MMDANKIYCGDHFAIYISNYVVHLKFRWCCMSIVSQQNWKKIKSPFFPIAEGFILGVGLYKTPNCLK